MNTTGKIDHKSRNLSLKTTNKHSNIYVKVETKFKPKWIIDMTPKKSTNLNQINNTKLSSMNLVNIEPKGSIDEGLAGLNKPKNNYYHQEAFKKGLCGL